MRSEKKPTIYEYIMPKTKRKENKSKKQKRVKNKSTIFQSKWLLSQEYWINEMSILFCLLVFLGNLKKNPAALVYKWSILLKIPSVSK